jgi:predicted metal-dependent HD superfamily phosphohydrolase
MDIANYEAVICGKTNYYFNRQNLINMQIEPVSEFILEELRHGLPKHLTYHCVEHVLDVYQAAEYIGIQEGIAANDMRLLLTAALYHDCGFMRGPKDHEEASCNIAKETLPDFGYTSDEIERICNMIRATKIPQLPKNHLEEILADADLDYLGRDDFFTTGENLFKEFCFFGVVNTREDWNKLQVRFLEAHHFFTQTSIEMRKKEKEKHLELIKSEIKNR